MEQLERIEQRQIERDQQLMKAIRETQEAKKQLAATQKKEMVEALALKKSDSINVSYRSF